MIPRAPLGLLVLLIGAVSFGLLSVSVDRRKLPVYAWLCLVIFISFVPFRDIEVISIITRLVNFIIGLLLLKVYWAEDRQFLSQDLKVLLLPLAFVGVATFLLGHLAPALFSLFDSNGQRMYSFLGVFNYSAFSADVFDNIRPMTIFWEPGVFQIYLNILLFILFNQQAKLRNILITVAAIFATQSSMGIIVAMLQVTYFLGVTTFSRGNNFRKIALLCAVIAAFPILFQIAERNVSEKISGALSGSSAARIYDWNVGMRVIAENPIFGIGFNESTYLRYADSIMTDTSVLSLQDQDGRFSTNGIMIALYSIGLPLGLVFIGAIFFQNLIAHRSLFGTVILFSLVSSPLAFSPFVSLFAFSGMTNPAIRRWFKS